jgi:hypothetical protein
MESSGRIAERFELCKKAGRPALVAYLTAGIRSPDGRRRWPLRWSAAGALDGLARRASDGPVLAAPARGLIFQSQPGYIR